MITETLDHDRDIGVRACYKLATQGTIFFFYLYMSFKKEKTEDRPIHKCHKNAQVRSKHQIVQDVVYFCVPVYCIYCHTCTYICVQDLYRHISIIA